MVEWSPFDVVGVTSPSGTDGAPGPPGDGPGGDRPAGERRAAAVFAGWVRRRLRVGERDDRAVPPLVRRLGVLWVAASVVVTTATSAFVEGRDGYVFVLVFMACGAYTAPALVAGWFAVRRAPDPDRLTYQLVYAGIVGVVVIGLGMLGGLATGWRWANPLGVPSVAGVGLLFMSGLTVFVRSRSGRRALLVDAVEAVAAAVAVMAPMVVLWGPAVVEADESWFTVPAALAMAPLVGGLYWTLSGFARQGLVRVGGRGAGWGLFESFVVALSVGGCVNVALQTAQGVSGFSLPAPPLIALNALSTSMFWLVTLYVPLALRPGLDRLSPQAQARSGWVALGLALAGTSALVVATLVVAGERPWAVPFSFGVVTLLLVLLGIQQVAALGETRRLYRRVEEASDERRLLLARVLDRAEHDRRRFADQLHEQAVSAYASFTALAMVDRSGAGPAGVSELLQENLQRHADSLRDLIVALRPADGGRREPLGGEELQTPVAAFLDALYGDRAPPRLEVSVAEPLPLDWVTETVLLQVVREALCNVRRHSQATRVAVELGRDAGERDDGGPGGKEPDRGEPGRGDRGRSEDDAGSAGGLCLRVVDDGVGFDPAVASEGSGIGAMSALAAVLDGSLAVRSRPGAGTAVVATFPATPRSSGPAPGGPPGPTARTTAPAPALRLVRGGGGDPGTP